jgi:hypothetical protein
LEKLSRELTVLEGSALHQRAAQLFEGETGSTTAEYFSTLASEMAKAVGFRSLPTTGEEFLTTLVTDVEEFVTEPRGSEEPDSERARLIEWDIFICHASEDKEDLVRPLAAGLRKQGFKVWFDEFTLVVGDSLRRSIDLGLARSRFGGV